MFILDIFLVFRVFKYFLSITANAKVLYTPTKNIDAFLSHATFILILNNWIELTVGAVVDISTTAPTYMYMYMYIVHSFFLIFPILDKIPKNVKSIFCIS